ncbi:replication restart helicase PriA [Mucilaginibacter arboris]|nr:primosomal protein N' [Mucilaginibacter arboris]
MMLDLSDSVHIEKKTLFAEVVLPLPIAKNYTYRVPFDRAADVNVGKRVVVQFGKSKLYTGVIISLGEKAPEKYEAKYLMDILDDEPLITPQQLAFWDWISGYYLCNPGEVMNAALPAALKLASETRISLNTEYNFDKSELNDKEFLIIDALEIQAELTVSEVSKLLGQKTVMPVLKMLFNKNIIHIAEEVNERYKPRKRSFYGLNPVYRNQEQLKELFEILEKRAPKQLDAVLALLQLSKQKQQVTKAELEEAAQVSTAVLKALVEKEIFLVEERIVSRFSNSEEDAESTFELNEYQEKAFKQINQQFEQKDVVLLHGITSSGKTQIYVRLIEAVIESGKQVLFLLPEIALTIHIIERLRQYFGNKIGVYHSRFNDNERVEVWNKVLSGEYKVVLGARSSVFLPFNNLGLIVVDEEHENSYKQFDPAPRYHARDAAIYLSTLYKAKVLLGSATPSLESYYNAQQHKYGLVELNFRFGEAVLPEIQVISIPEETKNKTMQSHFSTVLMQDIESALEKKEQAILFQNRRGYVPLLICKTCGFTPKCINCDVSLTLHKSTGKLHCHYCGYKEDVYAVCPACGSVHLEQKGYGTEKIEDELSLLLPSARIVRMDLDTTRTKMAFQNILSDLEDKKTDILVGTQMVAKGLDFSDVTVIGIVNADSLLKFPDFRANERSFQMLAQVSGRAGRRGKKGKVVIQTYDPHHRVISQVIRNDYAEMYQMEMAERLQFKYPPFYRIIQLDVKHKNAEALFHQAEYLGNALKKQFGDRVLGPEFPLINRIRNYYIKTIILKIEKEGTSMVRVKNILKETIVQFQTEKISKGNLIRIDVDPY